MSRCDKQEHRRITGEAVEVEVDVSMRANKMTHLKECNEITAEFKQESKLTKGCLQISSSVRRSSCSSSTHNWPLVYNSYIYSCMKKSSSGGVGRGAKRVWWSHGALKNKSEVSKFSSALSLGPSCCITPAAHPPAYPVLMVYVSCCSLDAEDRHAAADERLLVLGVRGVGVRDPLEPWTPWPLLRSDVNKKDDGRAAGNVLGCCGM